MRILIVFLFILNFNNLLFADSKTILKDRITSPYKACQNQILVSEKDYKKKKDDWIEFEASCKGKVLITPDAGITTLDPLNEGVRYLDLSSRVVKKVLGNLEKSQAYAKCSEECFKGKEICTTKENNTPVLCKDRKKEVTEALAIFSRQMRMELALADAAPGLMDVNIKNALTLSETNKDKFINTNLHDLEIGTPNPVGRVDLNERELVFVKSKRDREFQNLKDKYAIEFKKDFAGANHYSDWMSIKLMERFDEHKARYRQILYEDAPILGVINGRPTFNEKNEPSWTDAQIAEAFAKLYSNAELTKKRAAYTLQSGKLEFSRFNTEALRKWFTSFDPTNEKSNDLLFYMGMKNQVEDVLKEDPSMCGTATAMDARLKAKTMQNAGATFAASLGSGFAGKLGGGTFKVLSAITSLEVTQITGLALGSAYLGNSFNQFNTKVREAQTFSGTGGEAEGKATYDSESISTARENFKMALAFAPMDGATAVNLTQKAYGAVAKKVESGVSQEAKNAASKLYLNVKKDKEVLDAATMVQVESNASKGILTEADREFLIKEKGSVLLTSYEMQVDKKLPISLTNAQKIEKSSIITTRNGYGEPFSPGKAVEILNPHAFPENMRLVKYENKVGDEVLMYEKVVANAQGKSVIQSREMPIDPLTGAFDANYPAAKLLLEDLIKDKAGKATFAFIDVNNLGYVNNNFIRGREAGDTYLKSVANAITEATEGKAQLFKLGGDEYGVIIHEADPKLAQGILQKIIDACYSKKVHQTFRENSIGKANSVKMNRKYGPDGKPLPLTEEEVKAIKDYASYSREGISIGAVQINKGDNLLSLLLPAEAQATKQKIVTKEKLNISATKYGGSDVVLGKKPDLTYKPTADLPVTRPGMPEHIKVVEKERRNIATVTQYGADSTVKQKYRFSDITVSEHEMPDGSKILKYTRYHSAGDEKRLAISRELVVNSKVNLIDGTHESGKAILNTLADGKNAAMNERGMVWINAQNLGKINYFKDGTATGDKLLAITSRILEKELKEGSIPLKMQGSEFVAFQNKMSHDEMNAFVKKLNTALSENPEIKKIYSDQVKYLEKEITKTKTHLDSLSQPNPTKDFSQAKNLERLAELKKFTELSDNLAMVSKMKPEFSIEGLMLKEEDTLQKALEKTRGLHYK